MYIEVDICIYMYICACTYSTGKGGQDTRIWAGCLLGAFLELLSFCPSVACSAGHIIVMPHPALARTSCVHSMETIVAAVCAPARLPGLHTMLPPVPRRCATAPSRCPCYPEKVPHLLSPT